MKVFVAPLNWGLGHATRCVPLIDKYRAEGAEVTIGGDGESLDWLRRRYPELPYVELAPLRLRYSEGKNQTRMLLRQLPHILCWLVRDHRRMNELLREYSFDLIISDNRFALYLNSAGITRSQTITSAALNTIYITHQLHIRLPRPWRWLEPHAQRVHAWFINRYSECWVPDYPDFPGLAGELSHPKDCSCYRVPIRYLGPLSRFSSINHQSSIINPRPLVPEGAGKVLLLLSGLEPQRSLLRAWAQSQYPDVEVIEGSVDDAYIARRLYAAGTIIARSGYSTIMDLKVLGLLNRFSSLDGRPGGVLIPTPGQSEQEYLATLI